MPFLLKIIIQITISFFSRKNGIVQCNMKIILKRFWLQLEKPAQAYFALKQIIQKYCISFAIF
jgi:hypothetical protein